MARELERSGIPTAMISALPEIPLAMGVPRIVRGIAITHLMGDPALPTDGERRRRVAIVRAALESLRETPDRPTVFGAG